jgi:hypothetical protein
MTATSETSVPRSSRPKRRWRLRAHLWRLVLIFSFLLISNRFVLSIVGVFNRFFPVIKVVFLAYPASEEMFRRYTYFGVGEWARWRPALIGVFDQQGSWGLMFAITATEKDFERREAAPRLQQLYARMEALRKAVGAEEVRFAGVLPGRLSVHGVTTSEAEVDAAMAAAMRGEAMVRAREKIDADAPVIVLDANSFIGQRLLRELAGRNVYPVDSNRLGPGAANKEAWPAHLSGKPALLMNVSRSRTPAAYLDLLWDSIVVLNEAYPEPPRSVLDKFAARACRFYHLAGAAGKAYPDFPWPYTDAVPCCAARIGQDTELVLRKLT